MVNEQNASWPVNVLAQVRIVLVETSHPGNLGSVARAMKTMGLSQLVLVNPKASPADPQAIAMASGASDILQQAKLVDSVAAAVATCTLVVGTSARLRVSDWPQLTAKETAAVIFAQPKQGDVALLFGRENSGLTNQELDYCHYLGHVSTNPVYGSLNLAMGVQLFAYELWTQMNEAVPTSATQQPIANLQVLDGFYQHLQQTLLDAEFLDARNPEKLMRRFKRLCHRAQLEVAEVRLLRGVLRRMQRMISLAKPQPTQVASAVSNQPVVQASDNISDITKG